jgi:hypothetical protein
MSQPLGAPPLPRKSIPGVAVRLLRVLGALAAAAAVVFLLAHGLELLRDRQAVEGFLGEAYQRLGISNDAVTLTEGGLTALSGKLALGLIALLIGVGGAWAVFWAAHNLVAQLPYRWRERVVPFLTAKHPLEYCLGHAARARQHGFPALVVLGGDRRLGYPRAVEHAWQLRQAIRGRASDLVLGGWANPNGDAVRQVSYLLDPRFAGEFYLTQIVTHHDVPPVERFMREASRGGLALPGVFGVFYYRSANPRTLSMLGDFIPVPAEGLAREFSSGASADEVCARTIRAMKSLGARHFYISNLPIDRAAETLAAILHLVEGG